MRAIILAAGRGSRMKTLTTNQPKCLLKVKNKPLIEWQLEAFSTNKIKKIALVTGYKREMLEKYSLKEFFNSNWQTTQMVSSLVCASKWLESEPCIVSYSDIFYRPEIIKSLINSGSELAIAYDPNWLELWEDRFDDPLSDAESFKLDENKNLLEIGKRPLNISEIEGQYMGLIRFTPQGWKKFRGLKESLPSKIQDSIHMTGMLQKLLELKKLSIEAIPNLDTWGEVDSQTDLNKSNKKVL